ncbi:hypothetical protein [Thiolapillus brandeum]|uniref:Phosphodiesterase n=1 Tax=Thiolapillus brandeum TaxID=1076588 RepID=A0A7U6JI61_9GAMM|nr:hypothetical protein [Thiolapillus brandeum]BAO44497.1 conserved hypothetical protein [Thiolapillus brandeum]
MMKALLISVALFAIPLTGISEVLLIDAIADEQQSSIAHPGHGDTMTEVEHRFGAPRTRHSPVGDPPITRWDYDEFSVYFEYDKVLTTVLKRKKGSASQ